MPQGYLDFFSPPRQGKSSWAAEGGWGGCEERMSVNLTHCPPLGEGWGRTGNVAQQGKGENQQACIGVVVFVLVGDIIFEWFICSEGV